MKDLYEILKIKQDASEEEIKRSYRKLALGAHPDRGGDPEIMGLLNEAYEILSDKDKRHKFDRDWGTFQEIDLDHEPIFEVDGYLEAGNITPFSLAFRKEHESLVQTYLWNNFNPASPKDYQPNTLKEKVQNFESSVYQLMLPQGKNQVYHTIFEFIFAKTAYAAGHEFLKPQKINESLTPVFAIHLFKGFLVGDYYSSGLIELKTYFETALIRLKEAKQNTSAMLLYEGIMEIIKMRAGSINSCLLSSITKITDFAATADDLLLPRLIPLFYNKYFRNLYAYALHLYWSSSENESDLKCFDGRLVLKEYLETLKNRLGSAENDAHFSKLVKYIKLLYSFESDLHATDDDVISAQDYREAAFHLLDWIPALKEQSSREILINIFLQIGIKFQQAATTERHPSKKKADEKLALKMYLTAVGIAHHATPDLEIYVNTLVIKYILEFAYEEPILSEILFALKKSTLVLVDVFPFFQKPQSNLSLLKQENSTLPLMRKLLNAMVEIHEYNKTHAEAITLDHLASTILYRAYEASLKNWYQEQYDPELEKRFRLELMDELLFAQGWTFFDVEEHIDSEWIMVDRDNDGWLKPSRELPYPEDLSFVKYCAINGAEIDRKKGTIHFFMTPWTDDRPVYEKLFSLADLQEMLEKKIQGAIFSLDGVDPDKPYHPFNQMRFEPKELYETELLNTMLLTDYILKFLTTNQEVQGQYPFEQRRVASMIQHLPKYLRQVIEKFHKAEHSGAIHRFWIEAEEIDLSLSEQNQAGNVTRIGLSDLKMVVKKHRMERDIHGELKDVGNEDEGWPIYVLTPEQWQELIEGKRFIEGHAMIFIHAEARIYYWEKNTLLKAHKPPKHLREPLIRLYLQPREADGLVKPVTKNMRLLHRLITEIGEQTGLAHRFSAEYIFALEFTIYYNEFAQFLPEFGRLRELCKLSALIRVLAGMRKSNKEEIRALDALIHPSAASKPDTEAFKAYQQSQQKVCLNIYSTFKEWRNELSPSLIASKWQKELNRIKGEIGVIHSSQYSGYRSQLYKLFSAELSPSLGASDYGGLIDSFLGGNIFPLADALTNYEKNKLYQDIQKQFPSSSLADIATALEDSSDDAVRQIAIDEASRQLMEQRSIKEKLEKGFLAIHLGKNKEPVDLNGYCFWVPASVRHEAVKDETSGLARHSFFVYGGVSAQPRINITRGGGSFGGNRVGGNNFNRQNITRGFQQHHMVSTTNKSTRNHDLFRLAGINPNSRANMIYLPSNPASHPTRSVHSGRHTNSYSEQVGFKMDKIAMKGRTENWTQQQYRAATRTMLSELRQQFREGNIGLNKNHRPWSNKW